MAKKELTREEKFQNYRDEIIEISEEEKEERALKAKKNSTNLHPLIIEFKKKRIQKNLIYYGILSIVTLVIIFLFIYYGVNYL